MLKRTITNGRGQGARAQAGWSGLAGVTGVAEPTNGASWRTEYEVCAIAVLRPPMARAERSAGPPELGLPSQILTRLQAESKAGTKKEE